jgi:ATP-dependent Lhr-like helicase
MDGLPESFAPATRAWLAAQFDEPTPVQAEGWPLLAGGQHALLVAPTGSGKTLAAFLASIDRLGRLAAESPPGVRVVYVSPLKALVYDIERNLRAPLAGIAMEAETLVASGPESDSLLLKFRPPRVAIRTGDSSAKERRQQGRDPAEILVTTPESLYLILGSKQRETLRFVETLIIDEIHALAPTKRGVHLMLSLERLARNCELGDPQRIGLSATARPTSTIARFLGGDRPVVVVDTSRAPSIELAVSVPVPDMTRPQVGGRTDPEDRNRPLRAVGKGESDTSLWPAIYPELLDLIRAHRSSILFVNSRGLCERLAHRLNELAEEPLVRAHHGSIAHAKRKEIEEALAAGELRSIVATSSLELGIDMASVELVMLVESPGAVSRGLQRIGRAGHAVGATSRGVIFPKHRSDLLEAAVVAKGMRDGDVEAITVPHNALDVLAQQIVAIVAEGSLSIDELEGILSRTFSYENLGRPLLHSVLDMLAGRYPSTDFAELRPRLHWDRATDVLEIREGAGRIALLSGGTIPDRGQYAVHLGEDGPRIGELDEEMVHETKPGDVVTLGASSWRALEITRDRVIVAPAPGEIGRLPFWRGDGPGRPIELGRALGRFNREIREQAEPAVWLEREHGLDVYAAKNLLDYLEAQQAWTGGCPTDERITIERFRDELGDWRLCILSPFGSRVHAPWALAIAGRLAEFGDFDAQPLWTDDGIMFRFANADRLPPTDLFLPEPDEIEELVTAQLEGSALFAAHFRENAARALLLPRQRPGARTPLWVQRLRSQNLHAVARNFPDFPIMLETFRSCMQDVFDLPGLVELMNGIRSREIAVDDVETPSASPFARSLVFSYTATYLYQVDMPSAERRTQALSLDRHMLRELLGAAALRELLDAKVIDDVEARRQGLDPETSARHTDGLHDALRRVGDLSVEELAGRFDGEVEAARVALEELVCAHRVIEIMIASTPRMIAAEEASIYRDALGVELPPNLPAAFLESADAPLEQLLMRFARTHGPFGTVRIAERFGLVPGQVEPILDSLAARGRLVAGEFDPRGDEKEWCEPEILRRIKRGTLERLRSEISPVSGDVLGRFLVDWHGINSSRRGESRFDEVIDLLEGLPLSFAELERSILPARLPGYVPRMLDELGAQGQLVWVGHRALGEKDGRVALYRRENIAALLDPKPKPAPRPAVDQEEDEHVSERAEGSLTATQHEILERLGIRGASFFGELVSGIEVSEGEELFTALWDLVWRGLVTNDTFAPLRALGNRPPPGRGRGRRAPPSATAGRWSLVAPLLVNPPSETERLHARTLVYLERHGIVSREAMGVENQAGGFGAVYPVLREMEETGRIRRGHFVEGMTSAQLAVPGAVDRMRSLRDRPLNPQSVLLAATDPAQPYGIQLPWPESRKQASKPRRALGCYVILVDGVPSLFIDKGGERVLCFEDESQESGAERLGRGLRVLVRGVVRMGRNRLSVETIDGERARGSDLVDAFVRAGFRAGYRGLEIDRPAPGINLASDAEEDEGDEADRHVAGQRESLN